MFKIRFATLALSVSIAILLLSTACSKEPSQPLVADDLANTTSTAAAIATAPVTTSDPSTTNSAISITPITSVSATLPPMLPEADISAWKLTEAAVIAIASNYVPAEIASNARITAGREGYGNLKTGENHLEWAVSFMNISITKDWLDWQPDSSTTLGSREPYNEIIVRIADPTGEFISREAYLAVFTGGPGMTPPFVNPWVPNTTDINTPVR